MEKTSPACTNSHIPIVVTGLIFLGIFIANIGLLLWYWKDNNHREFNRRQSSNQQHTSTPKWFPYAIVVMLGVAITGLYVMYYLRCDVTAAIVTLVLPLLGVIAVSAKWPSYSLNPLVFGYQVAYQTENNTS